MGKFPWKKVNDLGFGIQFWPMPWSWGLGIHSDEDEFGYQLSIDIGPIQLNLMANTGMK